MNTVTIRSMTPEDIPIVVNWMSAMPFWQRYRLTATKARSQCEAALRQEHIALVADVGPEDQACGFAWCLPDGAFGRSAYLRRIGVRAERTSQGIGALLLDQVERLAAEHSPDLFLLVADFNEAAQHFYRRQGYDQVGAIPGYVLPDVTELIFRKHLSKTQEPFSPTTGASPPRNR